MALNRRLHIITGYGPGSPCYGECFVRYFGRYAGGKGDRLDKDPKAICGFSILTGHVQFKTKTQDQILSKGGLFVVWPHQQVTWQIVSQSATLLWFNLKGRQINKRLAQVGLTRNTPWTNCEALMLPLSQAFKTIADKTGSTLFPIRLAWEILDSIKRSHGTDSKSSVPLESNLALACKEIIETDYRNDLQVAEIAKELDVDRTTLFRQFKNQYDQSPKEYLLSLRLQHALPLLRNSRLSIKQICFACGFNDPYYFSRYFRIKYGTSPSEWRTK